MTRGTLALLTNEGKLYQSTEFNGDMYWSGHGEEAYNIMQDIQTKEQLEKTVIDFNSRNHQYEEHQWIYDCEPAEKFLNSFEEDKYYQYWFSDYVYFKNASDEDIITKDYDGNELILGAGEVTILNFGTFYAPEN